MNAIVDHGRVREVPDQTRQLGTGPVEIPDMRVQEDLIAGVRLVIGPAERPTIAMPCASRAVAERTRDFFGGRKT